MTLKEMPVSSPRQTAQCIYLLVQVSSLTFKSEELGMATWWRGLHCTLPGVYTVLGKEAENWCIRHTPQAYLV